MFQPRRESVLLLSALVLASGLYGLWTPDLPMAELQKRHGLSSPQILEVDGLSIHYKASGRPDAPVLMLLHGFGSSLQTWDAWAPALEREYRVIRLDLPGFGLTGASPQQDYSDARDVSTLQHFADRLGLTQFAVIGHSLGGKLAWSLAAAEPERVKTLVLMAPDGFAPPDQWGTKPYEVPAIVGIMKYSLPKPLVSHVLRAGFSDPAWLTDAMVDRYHDMLRAPGVRQAILDRANQTMYANPVERLKQIKAPTLLLWGENDRMIPSSNAASYAQVLQHAQTVVLPHLGHVIQEEQPELGLAQLKAFLKLQWRGQNTPGAGP